MNKKIFFSFVVIVLLASFSIAEAGCFLGFIGDDCSVEKEDVSSEIATAPSSGGGGSSGPATTPSSSGGGGGGGSSGPSGDRMATYQGVLEMLSQCQIARLSSTDPPENTHLGQELTCNEYCDEYENLWGGNYDFTCIGGFIRVFSSTGMEDLMTCSTPWTIYPDNQLVTSVDCICCSPPS